MCWPREIKLKPWTCVIPVVCVKLERVCSQTQLCQLRCFNDYTRQQHVSAPTGHLQVVFKRTYIYIYIYLDLKFS